MEIRRAELGAEWSQDRWELIAGEGDSPRAAFHRAWANANLNAKVGRIVEAELFADEQTMLSQLRDSIDLAKDGKLWPR